MLGVHLHVFGLSGQQLIENVCKKKIFYFPFIQPLWPTRPIQSKYLGDIIDISGSIQATVDHRKTKGDEIQLEILSIINEIPLGKHRVEVALRLREAMLVNGILFNSEVWHGVTDAQIVKLESVDEALLRGLLKAHS